MNVKSETLIRTFITAFALINSVLAMFDIEPLPVKDEELYDTLSAVLAIVTTIWSWWKNNSFTYAAIEADEYMKELKKK